MWSAAQKVGDRDRCFESRRAMAARSRRRTRHTRRRESVQLWRQTPRMQEYLEQSRGAPNAARAPLVRTEKTTIPRDTRLSSRRGFMRRPLVAGPYLVTTIQCQINERRAGHSMLAQGGWLRYVMV
jgi:hypothetical protein